MIFWIVLLLLIVVPPIIGTIYYKSGRWRGGEDWWSGWGVSTLVGAFPLLLVALIGSAVAETSNVVTKVDKNYGLVALSNASTTSSQWGYFLVFGGGSTTSKQRVRFAQQDSDGGIKLGDKPVSASVIYENATPDTASLTVKHQEGSATWFVPWAISSGDSEYDFHVPAGTVKRSFTIDSSK